MLDCVTVPNFMAIGQTVAEIPLFWIFQDGGSHHLGFLTIGSVKKDELCQNLSKSFKPCKSLLSNYR